MKIRNPEQALEEIDRQIENALNEGHFPLKVYAQEHIIRWLLDYFCGLDYNRGSNIIIYTAAGSLPLRAWRGKEVYVERMIGKNETSLL